MPKNDPFFLGLATCGRGEPETYNRLSTKPGKSWGSYMWLNELTNKQTRGKHKCRREGSSVTWGDLTTQSLQEHFPMPSSILKTKKLGMAM
jgi:hypothetical protein